MGEQGMGERGLRSVFIGNIPYEVSEERLKEIFGQVGPVLSMKLVFDRDSGKPKGYGFCEYQDAETAMSAMRNLNGVEVNGRNLRVDNAGAQSHRMAEMGGGVIHNNGPSGPHEGHFPMQREREIDGPPPPERVPEIISKTVASLAPEQMFDLMKQMKQCIQNNPNEARTMLVQNPQLAYALLQAQVVMKMIDPQQALSMLHKDNAVPVGQILQEGAVGGMAMGGMGGPRPAFSNVPPPATDNPWLAAERAQPVMPMNPPGPFGPGVGMGMGNQSALGGDMDFRQIDPRLRNQGNPGQGNMPQDLDLRDPRAGGGDRYQMDPRQQSRDRDFREMRERDRDRDMRSDRDRDLRDRNPERHQRDSDLRDPRSSSQMSGSGDPRMSNPQIPLDPRARARAERDKAPTQQQQQQQQQVMAQQMSSGIMAGFGAGMADSDKAALIMQVLQLSDEQIAMLPAEQRQSIVALKEQIAKTTR